MNQYYTVIDEIFVKVETKVSMGCLSPYREPLDARDKPPQANACVVYIPHSPSPKTTLLTPSWKHH